MTDQAVTPDVPDLAHDAWGLATWGIIAVIAVAVASVYFGMRMLSVQRGTHTAICAVRDQVENDHAPKPNMRDDIDTLKRGQDATQAAVEMLAEQMYLLRHQLAEFGKDIVGLRRDDGMIRGDLRERAEAQRALETEMRALETRMVQAFRRAHPDAGPL